MSFTSLVGDFKERIFGRFDDGAWLHRSHGGDAVRGLERPHLAEW